MYIYLSYHCRPSHIYTSLPPLSPYHNFDTLAFDFAKHVHQPTLPSHPPFPPSLSVPSSHLPTTNSQDLSKRKEELTFQLRFLNLKPLHRRASYETLG